MSIDRPTALAIALTVACGAACAPVETAGPLAPAGPVADAGPDRLAQDLDGDDAEVVRLDGSGSDPADGAIVAWQWTDEARAVGAGETLTVSLPVGVHHLTLRVQDDRGRVASDEVVVTVLAAPESDDVAGEPPPGGAAPTPQPPVRVAEPAAEPPPEAPRAAAAAPGASCRSEPVEPLALYHIGHSLTDRAADLLNSLLEAESGRRVEYAYKSVPGASLYHHWSNPTTGRKGNVRSGDPLEILRSGRFDALVLTEQTGLDYFVPHPTKGSGEHANRWVDEFLTHAKRPDPRVFVYSTWYGRRKDGPDTAESTAAFVRETAERQPLWEAIAQAVRDAHPELPVQIVPGGLVLKALQERVLAGTLVLPRGLTFRETFFKQNRPGRGGCGTRDAIHLSETGIYTIALTHHAVIHRACVEGAPASIPYPGYDDGCVERERIDVDPDLAREIQRTVMDVVRGYPWTGL